jgi:hypothetical protein
MNEVNDIDKMKRNIVRERLEVKGSRETGSGTGSASASPRPSGKCIT